LQSIWLPVIDNGGTVSVSLSVCHAMRLLTVAFRLTVKREKVA
jgi:hypothetical protein